MTLLRKSELSLMLFFRSWDSFADTCLIPKTSENFSWHEPTNIPTFSSTSLIYYSPKQFSLLLQRLYLLLTCNYIGKACTTYKAFLLIVESSNVTEILSV